MDGTKKEEMDYGTRWRERKDSKGKGRKTPVSKSHAGNRLLCYYYMAVLKVQLISFQFIAFALHVYSP